MSQLVLFVIFPIAINLIGSIMVVVAAKNHLAQKPRIIFYVTEIFVVICNSGVAILIANPMGLYISLIWFIANCLRVIIWLYITRIKKMMEDGHETKATL